MYAKIIWPSYIYISSHFEFTKAMYYMIAFFFLPGQGFETHPLTPFLALRIYSLTPIK